MRENDKNHRNREENQAARALSPDFSKGSAASASMHADSSNGAANKEAFERFWQVYPRQEGKQRLEFIPVSEIDEVLEIALLPKVADDQ